MSDAPSPFELTPGWSCYQAELVIIISGNWVLILSGFWIPLHAHGQHLGSSFHNHAWYQVARDRFGRG